MGGPADSDDRVESFIARWRASEGAERAAYVSFLEDLCRLLEVDVPEPPTSDAEAVTYRFEYPVKFRDLDGSASTGRIDLYRKGKFVLEAKQSRQKGGKKEILQAQTSLFEADPTVAIPRGRRGADRAWDVLMLNARRQAEDYAKALPASHGWPPFLIICDVGHCFEFYADFTGQGKNYVQFPDRQRFRVYLDDLRDAAVRERIRTIWNTPETLDPTRHAARVTRAIAQRLAAVSKALEKKHDPEEVALFLMRCLFTMFAEDVELIPKDGFKTLLRDCRDNPGAFMPLVAELWKAMDEGLYSTAIRAQMKRFNGKLFDKAKVFPLGREEIGELLVAAEHDWREVEPAIFGTLLEQALSEAERAKLGAHYTPRAYVERLVVETVIEPLREDWRAVLGAAQQARDGGDAKGALALVEGFHATLCAIRVLDPACGTGNFLHVAQELMKKLEGEVLDAAGELGARERLGGIADRYVGPRQFLGMELNERAVAIADLVLWIGHLQWHFRTRGFAPKEPILEKLDHIHKRDAVLTWDGAPAVQFVEGRETYPHPRRPDWPEAEFIVGNPPFIGKGADLREALGDKKLRALWSAYPHMGESSDYVMYWWDQAANSMSQKQTRIRSFGFVTTNSVTQLFNRRTVDRYLSKGKLSLSMAIPNHPWIKNTPKSAAVRIAMSVVIHGKINGRLLEVTSEEALDTDAPRIGFSETLGYINSDFSVGATSSSSSSLKSNLGMSNNGMLLAGRGFVLQDKNLSIFENDLDHNEIIKPYIGGKDLVSQRRRRYIIDAFNLSRDDLRDRNPHIYQHLLATVEPVRRLNNRATYRNNWHIFAEPRSSFRPALAGLQRVIMTTETAKHRIFQFVDATVVPDHMIIAIALSDAFHLGVLSSRSHVVWALRAGGWLGIGNDPRYSKSRCFDPFPFPDATEMQKEAIRKPAEALDALRKQVLDDHPELTLTKLYNIREAIRAGQALDEDEAAIRDKGLVLILNEHHDAIDQAVAAAYGWPTELSDDDILARLVALNAQRAREEMAGQVRWLRPDYQRPRFARDGKGGEQIEAAELVAPALAAAGKEAFPTDAVERVAAVLAALGAAPTPLDADAIAQGFKQGLRVRRAVRDILVSLARVGEVSTADGGRTFSRRLTASG